MIKARVWSERYRRHFYHGDPLGSGRVEVRMLGDGAWQLICVTEEGAATLLHAAMPLNDCPDATLELDIGCDDETGVRLYAGDVVYVPAGYSGDYYYSEHFMTIEMDPPSKGLTREFSRPITDSSFDSCLRVRTIHDPESEMERTVTARREEKEKSRAEKEMAQERAEYERLKARFEKENKHG